MAAAAIGGVPQFGGDVDDFGSIDYSRRSSARSPAGSPGLSSKGVGFGLIGNIVVGIVGAFIGELGAAAARAS